MINAAPTSPAILSAECRGFLSEDKESDSAKGAVRGQAFVLAWVFASSSLLVWTRANTRSSGPLWGTTSLDSCHVYIVATPTPTGGRPGSPSGRGATAIRRSRPGEPTG